MEGCEETRYSERFLWPPARKAYGPEGEVRSMYQLACELEFVGRTIVEERRSQCLEISRQLGGFAKHLRAKNNRPCYSQFSLRYYAKHH